MVKMITSLRPPKTFISLHSVASHLLLPTGAFSVSLLNSLYLYVQVFKMQKNIAGSKKLEKHMWFKSVILQIHKTSVTIFDSLGHGDIWTYFSSSFCVLSMIEYIMWLFLGNSFFADIIG